MPYNAPRSLTDQEVYALTAYLLAANKLIGENDEIDAKTLPQGEDAEPRQLHHPVPGPDLSDGAQAPQSVMAGLDPAIPLIKARPCHIIGIAGSSPAMTVLLTPAPAPSAPPP